MPLQIIKPDSNRYCKALIHAPGGAGKTVLVGTAALDERTSPMLLLDFEGGSESLAGLDVDVAPIKSWDDFNEAYEILASGTGGYKACGIDSISETHKFALLQILKEEGPKRKDPELLEQRDYGKATVQMRRLLRHFRDLEMHVFFTSHTKEVEIPREGRVRVPDLAGQMAEEVAGLMSVVGYLAQFEDDDAELHRTLLLHSFPKYRIKARTPWGVVAPEEIIDPDVTMLLDVLGYGASGRGISTDLSSRGKEHVEDEVPVETQDGERQDERPLKSLSMADLKLYAEELDGFDLDSTGARTKTQIIAAIEEFLNAGEPDAEPVEVNA